MDVWSGYLLECFWVNTFNQALHLFHQVHDRLPSSKKVLEEFSNFLVMGGLWDDALPILKKCVQLHADSNLCQGNLVNYSLEIDDLSDQKDAIDACLKSDSNNLQCLNALGIYSLSIRKFGEALQVYVQMSKINGSKKFNIDEALIDWGIGLSYKGLGDMAGAINYFSMACRKRFEPACVELDKISH